MSIQDVTSAIHLARNANDEIGFNDSPSNSQVPSTSSEPSSTPKRGLVRINKEWSRILCSAYVMCDMKADSMFREERVKVVMEQIKKAMETKSGKKITDEAVKVKILHHVSSKQTSKNEKKSTRVGTKKRTRLIAALDGNGEDDDDAEIIGDEPKDLDFSKQLLD